MFDFGNILLVERRLTQLVRVTPYEILIYLTIFFLGETRLFSGIKSILPFSKLIIEKSQVFSTRSYAYLHRYTQIRNRGGTMCPPPGGNRVKGVDLGNFLRHFLFGTEKKCSLFVFLLSVEVFHCCNASSAV